jgi:CxxC motif-containing protein (DUF1111 family)
VARFLGWTLVGASLLVAALTRADVPSGAGPAVIAPGEPLPRLSAAELEAYRQGRTAFEAQKSIVGGLGPLFNEISCSRCHNRGGVGGSGLQVLTIAGRAEGPSYDALLPDGGPLVAASSVTLLRSEAYRVVPGCKLSAEGESVPARANVVTRRRTTPLFGLGLVEATPDATFVALAERQPSAVRGRVARPPGAVTAERSVGRFGWKAHFSTLEGFAAAAFRNELGITNPLFPDEQPPHGDRALLAGCDLVPEPEDDGSAARAAASFMRLLAPIPPLERDPAARAGDRLFSKVGCDACHVRRLTSGKSDILALSEREYHPFSDFLLHDMGSRADGVGSDGDAAPNEMRTAPLWGLRLQHPDRFLHDGRARSLADAIRQHEGQGSPARAAFDALTEKQQQELIAFVQTL